MPALAGRARPRRRAGTVVAALVVAALLVVAGWALIAGPLRERKGGIPARVARQLAAVFTIDVLDSSGVSVSQDSGFLAGPRGKSLSALHVLAGARRAEVHFANGRLYDVLSVDGSDSVQDAVAFRIGRRMEQLVEYPLDVAALTLATRDRTTIGERVTVIGSPEGLTNTLTDGLVSAVRDQGYTKLIQISAPISPGSSGGPVFDASGKVVGVVVEQNPEGQNLNFARPAARFVPLLAEHAAEPLAAFGERASRPQEESLYDELFGRGNVFFHRARYAEALSRYELATRVAPESLGAIYNAAMCLDRLGREKEAAARFRRYLALHPPEDEFTDFAHRWLASHASLLK